MIVELRTLNRVSCIDLDIFIFLVIGLRRFREYVI